jgi:hypothetical protein
MNNLEQLCAEIATLARRNHYCCEDSWYTCPKADGGSSNEQKGYECDCGADEHNAKVDTLLATLAQLKTKTTPTHQETTMFTRKQLQILSEILSVQGLSGATWTHEDIVELRRTTNDALRDMEVIIPIPDHLKLSRFRFKNSGSNQPLM